MVLPENGVKSRAYDVAEYRALQWALEKLKDLREMNNEE